MTVPRYIHGCYSGVGSVSSAHTSILEVATPGGGASVVVESPPFIISVESEMWASFSLWEGP